MKLTKLACTAMVAAVAFGSYSATAAAQTSYAGHTSNYAKLGFQLKLSSQQPDVWMGSKELWSYSTVKITNQDVLVWLAFLAQTTWPAGAQLEYDYESDQLVVADKTGTNILFYAGDGVENEGMYGYFDLDPFDEEGVYNGNYVDATPGSENYVEYYNSDFEFYIDDSYDDYANYMDLYGEGLTSETYSESWTSSTDRGSDVWGMAPVGTGWYVDQEYNLLTGSIAGNQTWSGPRNAEVVHVAAHHHSHK